MTEPGVQQPQTMTQTKNGNTVGKIIHPREVESILALRSTPGLAATVNVSALKILFIRFPILLHLCALLHFLHQVEMGTEQTVCFPSPMMASSSRNVPRVLRLMLMDNPGVPSPQTLERMDCGATVEHQRQAAV